MTLRAFDVPYHPSSRNALHILAQVQADLVAAARGRAMDEVGAAVAHQLNDPLTALLIYLHEVEQAGEHSSKSVIPAPVWEIIGKAVREAERVCAILQRMRRDVDTPAIAEAAIARGRDAIASLAHNFGQSGKGASHPPSVPLSDPHPLTPREREVLAEITAGASNKVGSYRLGISTRTFEVHRANIMRKLGARNAADLVRTVLSQAS